MRVPDRESPNRKQALQRVETEIAGFEQTFKDWLHQAWPFALTILSVTVLYAFLPDELNMMAVLSLPGWFLILVEIVLFLGLIVFRWLEKYDATRQVALAITFLALGSLIVSVYRLVASLMSHTANGSTLLRDAGLIWGINLLLGAILYWQFDQGGPRRRYTTTPGRPELLFPQMNAVIDGWENWKPEFFDYLFVAFTISTAFSPTDTSFLSWRVKLIMMFQAGISLVILALLAARAVNIL